MIDNEIIELLRRRDEIILDLLNRTGDNWAERGNAVLAAKSKLSSLYDEHNSKHEHSSVVVLLVNHTSRANPHSLIDRADVVLRVTSTTVFVDKNKRGTLHGFADRNRVYRELIDVYGLQAHDDHWWFTMVSLLGQKEHALVDLDLTNGSTAPTC